ncbi:helix-turn-helix domain-containing protein, partial [bacterium]|nr:helix-turn-helix domain-containing protein [bacterium]
RIKAATHMLNEEPNISITEIAYTCGFCSSQYFATVFKRIHGCRPKDFKKTQLKKRMISRN